MKLDVFPREIENSLETTKSLYLTEVVRSYGPQAIKKFNEGIWIKVKLGNYVPLRHYASYSYRRGNTWYMQIMKYLLLPEQQRFTKKITVSPNLLIHYLQMNYNIWQVWVSVVRKGLLLLIYYPTHFIWWNFPVFLGIELIQLSH